MATRKPPASTRTASARRTAPVVSEDGDADAVVAVAKRPASKPAARKAATGKSAAGKSPARKTAARKASAKPGPSRAPARKAKARTSTTRRAPGSESAAPTKVQAPRVFSEAERERRFNILLQATCLKAGTAAAIATITRRVPFLGRLAPVILGSVGETTALSKIQQQLVRDIIGLYAVELSDLEERGVILLATAANVGAKELSKATVEQLVKQLGGVLYRPVLARILPLAAVATDISAAVASTYAVGKRAQALCKLPGTGASNLSELLRGLSGIDQSRLFKWSSEALGLALTPFRGALAALIPGMR